MASDSIKALVDRFAGDLLAAGHDRNPDFFSSSAATMAEARNELYYLLGFVLQKDKVFLLSHGDYVLTEKEYGQFSEVYEKRKSGEPLAYLTGIKEFYGYNFFAEPSTLIPRPETELLVDEALGYLRGTALDTLSVCDLGSGTGCILLSVLKEEPRAFGIGIDINDQAVSLAKRNACALGLSSKANFYADDFTDGEFAGRLLAYSQGKKFCCLVSNPPYIPDFEYACLDRSVKNFEPQTALVSGENSEGLTGLFHIERLLILAEKVLESGGLLLFEHGYNQGDSVRCLCEKYAFSNVHTLYDLAGSERALYALKK